MPLLLLYLLSIRVQAHQALDKEETEIEKRKLSMTVNQFSDKI